MQSLKYLLIGTWFGFVLTKAEAVSWFRIQEMFRFQSFHMYGLIMSAVLVAMVSIQLFKRWKVRTISGEPITLQPKEFSWGNVFGGTTFGLGWAMTGACPGPLYALIGGGVPVMAVTLVAAISGTWVYGLIRAKASPLMPLFDRREFLNATGTAAISLGIGRNPRQARHLTILHTSDIHGQLDVHDEFFWEDGRAVFKKRGGFATLRTMINAIRKERRGTVLLVDGGDTFHGSAAAALSEGRAIVPLINRLGYDLVLPGNWEVVYGKAAMLRDFRMYSAAAICANMFHDEGDGQRLLFPPYRIFDLGGTRVGFIGYTDPFTGTRQSPAYSRGIRFALPEESLARYVKLLKEERGCALVCVVSHLGLTQQLHLANQEYARGVDYVLGGDTHERTREPLQGKFARVTEPGAFGSFLGRLDLVLENGKVREERYTLLEVDPDRYPPDGEMTRRVAAAKAPYQPEIRRVVGRTTTPLLRYYVLETPLDNLITDALLWRFKTDLVVSNGFRFCPPLVPGPSGSADITMEYLWSALPVDSLVKTAEVTGAQIRDWLERELENVFAEEAADRFGGWFVRFKGMTVSFRIKAPMGSRLQDVNIGGRALEGGKVYSMLACEREGDPDDVMCRMKGIAKPRRLDVKLHDVLVDYLAQASPVSPDIEGRAVALDGPARLLSQVEGTAYRFR